MKEDGQPRIGYHNLTTRGQRGQQRHESSRTMRFVGHLKTKEWFVAWSGGAARLFAVVGGTWNVDMLNEPRIRTSSIQYCIRYSSGTERTLHDMPSSSGVWVFWKMLVNNCVTAVVSGLPCEMLYQRRTLEALRAGRGGAERIKCNGQLQLVEFSIFAWHFLQRNTFHCPAQVMCKNSSPQ